MSRRAVRWLVVTLRDGSEVVVSPRLEHLGAASSSLDSADAIWNEQPVWPTLRDACESLVAARAP